MAKLNYQQLKHSKIEPARVHSVKNSFYMRRSIGQVGQYRDNYFGDPSVFRIARSTGGGNPDKDELH